MLPAHRRRLRHRPVAPGRQFEIFAPEQVGVGGEERGEVDHRHEEQRQRREVDEKGEAGEAQAVEERPPGRQRPARRLAGEIRALDDLGGLVHEEAGDQGRHRRQGINEGDHEPGPGEEERKAFEDRILGADRIALEIIAEQARQREPQQRQERQRQSDGAPQDAAQRAREDLPPRGEGCPNQQGRVFGVATGEKLIRPASF